MSYLRRFPRFDGLTGGDMALLERILVVETVKKGHVFVREGDYATAMNAAMYVVIEGNIEVHVNRPEGGFGIQRELGPGVVFGHVALVADVRRTATCTAATPVTVARLDRRTFEELNNGQIGLYARFQLVVARQLASDMRGLREALGRSIATGEEMALRAE
jgi:CRP-like cAMP-binding protein